MNSSSDVLLLLWENSMICCCLALLSVSVIILLIIALYIQCTKKPEIHNIFLLIWPRNEAARRTNPFPPFFYQQRLCSHIETPNWPGNEAARRTNPFVHQSPHIETPNWPGNEAAKRTNPFVHQSPHIETPNWPGNEAARRTNLSYPTTNQQPPVENSATRRKRKRANREPRLQTSTVPSPAPMDCSDTVIDLKEELSQLNAQLVEENDKLKEDASQLNAQLVEEKDKLKEEASQLNAQLVEENDKLKEELFQLNAQLVEEKDKLKKVSKLSAQLVEEKDKSTSCVVCFGNKREVLLKPCNHFCLCVSCLPKLKRCPICNQTISSSENINIFHA